MLTRGQQTQLVAQVLAGERRDVAAATQTDAMNVKKAFGPDVPAVEGPGDAVVMFVDIAGFSGRVRGLPPVKVRQYLSKFYAKAIKVIDDHQGLIDRIIGDGIVAVFSQTLAPDLKDAAGKALKSAETIIADLNGTECESKAAISCGSVLFCKTGLEGVYTDYTVLGSPLTHVYRMEELAKANQVVVPKNSPVGAIIKAQLDRRHEHEHRAALGLERLTSIQWGVKIDSTTELRGAEDLGALYIQTLQSACVT